MSTSLIIGKFGAPFGVKGWIKIHSYTEPHDNIFTYSPWYVKEGEELLPIDFVDAKVQDNGLIALMPEIIDRDEVKIYTNLDIHIMKEQLANDCEDDQYYYTDLIGCEVSLLDNTTVGTVTEVRDNSAQDLLVIDCDGEELLIPFVMPHIIKSVDIAAKRIVADWVIDLS